jgi:hypothetical protein
MSVQAQRRSRHCAGRVAEAAKSRPTGDVSYFAEVPLASNGPSYRQSRFSITLQPVVAIFLPPTHAHLVVDHRYGVMSGGAQMLIVLDRTPCLFLATQLRQGGGQDEVENGRPILIHAVDFDDLVVIAR